MCVCVCARVCVCACACVRVRVCVYVLCRVCEHSALAHRLAVGCLILREG